MSSYLLQVQSPMDYVDWGNMVVIVTGILTLVAALAYIVFKKLGSAQSMVVKVDGNEAKVKSQMDAFEARLSAQNLVLLELKSNQTLMLGKLGDIEYQRNKDILKFTEAIGALNTTLAKIEVTLESTNSVMVGLKEGMKEQEMKIERLRGTL